MAKTPTASDVPAATTSPLADQFPELYFDEKTVVEKTLKATPPSLAQIFLKVLVGSGINNPGIAGTLAQIASDYYKGA